MLGQKIKIPVGGDFEPLPVDKYTTMIVDVELVTQFNQFKGENQRLLNYKFVVLDDKPMPEKIGGSPKSVRGRFLWKRCSISLSEKSWLYRLAKAVVGRDLTEEELENFDPESLVGKQVDVMIDQVRSKDGFKVFNNIVSFTKTQKPLEPVDVKSYQKETAEVENTTKPVFEAPELGEEGALDFSKLTLDEVLKEDEEEQEPKQKKKVKVDDFPLS